MGRLINRPILNAGGGNGLLNGLIAYWDLDEASGNRSDSHASFTLTDNNTVGSATGKISNAASFVRSNNEYFSRSTNDVFTGTGAMSISAWFKHPDTSSQTSWIINFAGLRGGAPQMINANLRANGDMWVAFQGVSTDTYKITGPFDDDLWHHIVVIKPADAKCEDVIVYIDDTLESGDTSNTTSTIIDIKSNDFRIGTNEVPSSNWDGEIDEFGYWSRALTAADVTALYNGGSGLAYSNFDNVGNDLATSLVSYWDLDEASGTRVDSHGSNDMTLTGTDASGTGILGNCFQFSNPVGQLTTSASPSNSLTGGVTISAWVRNLDTNASSRILHWEPDASADYGIKIANFSTTEWAFLTRTSGNFGATTDMRRRALKPTGTTWSHAVIVCASNGDITAYMDGTLVTASSGSAYGDGGTGGLRLGSRLDGSTGTIAGDIDEVGFWERTLSADDVTTLYNGGSGLSYATFD